MSNVYNQVGSLTSIKTRLHQEHIHDFKSINELLAFQRNYSDAQKQITSNHTQRIEEEKAALKWKLNNSMYPLKKERRDRTKITEQN
ncbi:MAG: hypothetical protein IPN26_11750 [Bacteroidetes bacterium]|nr:hypothetical protein [Bacteroidota bacterium]